MCKQFYIPDGKEWQHSIWGWGNLCVNWLWDSLIWPASIFLYIWYAIISHCEYCPLHWRHNVVSNPQLHDRLLSRLFRCRSKNTSKPRVTGLCAGNSPVTGEFPAQRVSTAENVSIWWRHHISPKLHKPNHDFLSALSFVPTSLFLHRPLGGPGIREATITSLSVSWFEHLDSRSSPKEAVRRR